MTRIFGSEGCRRTRRTSAVALALGLALALLPVGVAPVQADGGVTFTDIADGGGAGVDYARTPSPRIADKFAMNAKSPIPIPQFQSVEFFDHPMKPWGSPGVAIADFDGDGDQDIYATNGPGTPNSLFSNQLVETGSVTFVDVGAASGAGVADQDSSAVCVGDIDNDNDVDIFVVSSGDPYRLLENQGDGTFADISPGSGATGPGGNYAIGCSMADFDNDGLLDIYVGNNYGPWDDRFQIVNGTFTGVQHNELFMNLGGNTFAEVGQAAGIQDVSNMPPPGAAMTWAIGTIDYDMDGDVDIVSGDNQGPAATSKADERGWNRIFENDGSGNFTDVTQSVGMDVPGAWMGLAFADFNCDQRLDIFSTNFGNYVGSVRTASSFFLRNAGGTYDRLAIDELGPNPFGWGASPLDYDNDGDFDLIYHGSMDNVRSIVADNPGVLYQNVGDCAADFVYDQSAILKDHRPRSVNGVAVGDLNNDGFDDIVSVSNFDTVPFNFFPFVGIVVPPRGGVFDSIAFLEVAWFPLIPGNFVWVDPAFNNGTLSVELNSADNGNSSVQLSPLGGADLATGASVNRSGIGAVVSFTPDGGATASKPVVGGASYGSQDSLRTTFGIGQATGGTAEVFWPGGVRNRLYDVQAGEDLVLPEIPCSYDGDWQNFGQYNSCVMQALNSYKDAGLITDAERNRLRDSAVQAFHDAQ